MKSSLRVWLSPYSPRSLRVFRHGPYARLWTGAFVSNVGTWMETLAVGIHVTQMTGKAGWTGTIAALVYVPAVVLGPVGGALADRVDRRRYLMWATALQFVLAAGLAVLAFTHHLSLLAVGALMTLTGCAHTLLGPAYAALVGEVVPEDELLSALSLNSAQYNLARVFGPTLAAAIISTAGLPWAFGVNALSFVAVVIAVRGMPKSSEPHPGSHPRLWSGVREGFAVARADEGLRVALGLTFATSLLISPFIGLVPAFALGVLHGNPAQASFLVAAQGVGAVIAGVGVATLAGRWGQRLVLTRASLALGPIAAMYWLAPTFTWALPALFYLGAVYLGVVTGSSTVCLSRVSRRLQARINSVFAMVLGGGYAVGLVLQGWLGDQLGLRWVALGAALLFTGMTVAARIWRPQWMHALDAPSRFLSARSGEHPVVVGPPLDTDAISPR